MASQYFAILTDYGTRAIAHALSQGQPLQLAKFAVGDGNGQAVTPTASATALVHQTHIAPVSAVSLDHRNNKQVIVELTIPENVGGFYIREMGVFDSQNKLIAYANCPESFKPTESSGSGKVQVLRMILKVESSSAVTLSIDNSVIFVTRQQMTPKTITATTQNGFDESGHSHEINKASTSQQGIVQLTNDTGLESESLALTAKAGKKLAQQTAQLQLNVSQNYIHNSKKSSAVNSNSADTVATSAAVKTANDNANGRVSKSGDTMTGDLTVPNIIVNDPTNNNNFVQIGDDTKLIDVDMGHTVGLQTTGNTNDAYIAYGATQKRFGFDGSRFSADSSISTAQYGHGSYAAQYTSNAPYMVEESGSATRDTYHPFIKGRVRKHGQYGTAFSFGYTTRQGAGDGFGRGIIHLIEDNGKNITWNFEHNGDFISSGDVWSSKGKSINDSVQISELVGEVAFFARTTPPSGWLKANGAAVSRTTYAALFAAIGTTFGAGDGRTTFNLPDLRGEFVRGLDDGRNVDNGRRLGSAQGDAIRNITGEFGPVDGNTSAYTGAFRQSKGCGWGATRNEGRALVTFDASRVVPTANENRPRNIALLACIKY